MLDIFGKYCRVIYEVINSKIIFIWNRETELNLNEISVMNC